MPPWTTGCIGGGTQRAVGGLQHGRLAFADIHFQERQIPEIKDLNVLPEFRRRGVGTALIDALESRIAERSPTGGVGVGLYADYGPAQRMYILRGYVPDGRGAFHGDQPLLPGESVPVDDALVLYMTKRLASNLVTPQPQWVPCPLADVLRQEHYAVPKEKEFRTMGAVVQATMNYIDANTKGRERLQALVRNLTDKDLRLEVGDGWTIAAILAHLAFWDYRVLALLVRWKSVGIGPSPIDVDGVNEAAKPLCRAIPGRKAASLAVHAAEAVDTELANLPEDLKLSINRLAQEGKFRLDRSIHRNAHLNQIESILAQSKRKGKA